MTNVRVSEDLHRKALLFEFLLRSLFRRLFPFPLFFLERIEEVVLDLG